MIENTVDEADIHFGKQHIYFDSSDDMRLILLGNEISVYGHEWLIRLTSIF